MKYLIALLLLVHGGIHLLGLIKAYGWAPLKGLPIRILRAEGTLWAIAGILFLTYAAMYSTETTNWWNIGALAMLLSQGLIIWQWKQARAGTIPNVLLALHCLAGYTFFNLNQDSLYGTRNILQNAAPYPTGLLNDATIDSLPVSVQRWMRHAGVMGKPQIRSALITQNVRLKMKPGQKDWWPATATQWTYLPRSGFTWKVDVHPYPLLHFYGKDEWFEGKGSMYISLNGWFPVVNAQGPKIDEGALQRYLGEMVWCPSLAVSPEIQWMALNDSSAKATLSMDGTTGNGNFYWNQRGDLLEYRAMRYMGNESDADCREWIIRVQGYHSFEGIRVPSKMTATWKLDSGEWTWLELELKDVKYNPK